MKNFYKAALRTTYRGVRRLLTEDYQQLISAQICQRILDCELYKNAKRIGLYHKTGGEINLSPIWHAAISQGKTCYFPVITSQKTLHFLPASPATPSRVNSFKILEPDLPLSMHCPLNELDLLFLPLLAFDAYGNRLGQGAGYYDKTLGESSTPLLLGVAYAFQEESYLLNDPWDVRLDFIITEKAIIQVA